MTKTCISIAARALLFEPYSPSAVELDPVIVIATRTAQTLNDKLASVSLIDRNDIDRLQADSLQEHLRALPGLDIANNGTLGRPNSVFL